MATKVEAVRPLSGWSKSQRRASVALAACGAAVYLITRGLLVSRFPPFFDEGTYAYWTLQGFEHAGLRFVSLDSQVQPLAMWLGMLFMKIGAQPLAAMGLVSLCAGAVTATSIVLIGRRTGGATVAVAAGGLYLVLPYFVVHDAVGILDPVVVAAAMAALYLQLLLAEQPRLDVSLLLGFALAAGILAKPTGVYAMALFPFSLLCFDWSRERLYRRLSVWGGYGVLSIALALLGHLITRLSPYNVALFSPNGAAPRTTRPIGQALGHPLRWAREAWGPLQDALTGYVTWPVLLLALLGVVLLVRARPRLAILLALWTAVPIVADLLVSLEQYPRLILESAPPIVLFAAYGLVAGVAWARGRLPWARRWVVAAIVVLLLVPALTFDEAVLASPSTAQYPGLDDWQYATGWPSGAPWAPLARDLRQRANGRPASVVLSERTSYALQIDLRNDVNIALLSPGNPKAGRAPYAVVNSDSLPQADNPGSLIVVRTWRRPRGGDTTELLARAVVWRGRLYMHPKALRASLGLPDAQFDAFLTHHPRIRRWYHDVLG